MLIEEMQTRLLDTSSAGCLNVISSKNDKLLVLWLTLFCLQSWFSTLKKIPFKNRKEIQT